MEVTSLIFKELYKHMTTKNIIKNIFGICAIGIMSGCACFENTGLTDIDMSAAKESGINIIDFKDDPIFAYIDYDYANVDNFDPSKLSVVLKHNIKAPDLVDYAHHDFRSVEGIEWTKMCKSGIDGEQIIYAPDKPVTVVDNSPGHMKILSMDDIGTYVLTYKN